jgi:heterodisulfide reductase subunit A
MAGEKTQPQGTSAEKIGVYICHCGGNISDHVDVEAVCEQAARMPGVTVARTNTFMCSDPGQELIIADLKSGAVDRVVVASCAPSLHEETFRDALARAGVNPYVYEHANIREQVSWVHHGAAATEKAVRLVGAAAAKASSLKPLEPIRVAAKPHATVIGGGVAGLKAAKDLADRSIEVLLVEKSPFLGGRTAHLDRLSPTGESAAALVAGLARQVLDHPRITVYPCAQVTGCEGYIGNFKLTITRRPPAAREDFDGLQRLGDRGREPGAFIPFVGVFPGDLPADVEAVVQDTGVIVIATGFRPYMPRVGEFGFGAWEEVVTLPDFLRMLALSEEGDTLRVNGRDIRSIAMVHCVGSRQIPGIHEEDESGFLNEHCSRTCCSATLQAANLVRLRHPATRVFEYYRDIRTYGRHQEDLYTQASRNKVVFFRFEADSPPRVARSTRPGTAPLTVTVKDTLTFGEEVHAPADLVVLAVGMEPNDVADLVGLMKLPVGADRFLLEVHPKLRPVELSVMGMFLAGTCQAPMDVGEACAAASAAAVKASAVLARSTIELDPFVAEVDLDRCTGTGACVEACLRDGALTMVTVDLAAEAVRRPQVNPALCLGCGACVAVCPTNAIDVSGWTLKQYEDMVDRIVSDAGAA